MEIDKFELLNMLLDVRASKLRFPLFNIIGFFSNEHQFNMVISNAPFKDLELSAYQFCLPSAQFSISKSSLKPKWNFFNKVIFSDILVYKKASPKKYDFKTENKKRLQELRESSEFDEFYQKILGQFKQLEVSSLSKENKKNIIRNNAKAEYRGFIEKFVTKYKLSISDSIDLLEELLPELKVEEIMNK